MRHLRTDYDAIQAWPTKRPHHGIVTEDSPGGWTKTRYLDLSDDSIEQLGDSIEPIIPDDEPVFILRAKDVTAPAVVRFWSELVALAGGDLDTCTRVQQWADQMEAYAIDHYDGGKVPDTPAEFLGGD